MDLTHVYLGNLVKSRDEAGNLLVAGSVSDPTLDSDKQSCDPAWLKEAVPAWFKWGNVREQHNPRSAAGVAIEYAPKGDAHHVIAKVIDPVTEAKVEAGVLKGWSVGIANPRVDKSAEALAKAPGGVIVGGEIIEVSLVDRPANPSCLATIAKSVGGTWRETGDLVETLAKGPYPYEADDAKAVAAGLLVKTEYGPGPGGVLVKRFVSKADDDEPHQHSHMHDHPGGSHSHPHAHADSASYKPGADAPHEHSHSEDDPPLKASKAAKAMSTAQINDLPDSDFAYIEPGATKDADGKTTPRSKRHFPVNDAAHVRNALARAPQSPFGAKAMPAIKRAAKKFGIDVGKTITAELGKALVADVANATLTKAVDDDENPLLLAALQAVCALIAHEAEEAAEGDDEMACLNALVSAYSALRRFAGYEAAEGEIDAAQFDVSPNGSSYMLWAAKPAVVKMAAKLDIEPTALAGLLGELVAPATKAADPPGPAPTTGDDDVDLTKFAQETAAATVEALTKAMKGGSDATKAALDALGERLAKVEKSAAPGGPVKTVTATAGGAPPALAKRVAELTDAIASSTDPMLRKGYELMLRDVRAKIDAA